MAALRSSVLGAMARGMSERYHSNSIMHCKYLAVKYAMLCYSCKSMPHVKGFGEDRAKPAIALGVGDT